MVRGYSVLEAGKTKSTKLEMEHLFSGNVAHP